MRGEYYYDDGEEWSDEDGRAEYLFFIHNVPEAELLEVVGTIARRPDVPDGVCV